jgi:hypothetical protein
MAIGAVQNDTYTGTNLTPADVRAFAKALAVGGDMISDGSSSDLN